MVNRLSTIAALLMLTTAAPAQLAHEDSQWYLDRQPPYVGPGYRLADGGLPPLPFTSNGIQLLSWIPASEFGATGANSCFGYVAPSGREYAVIGLSNGTGFVEITNAGNAQIVALMTGPSSGWRDMRVYQDHSYSISEGGGGIQVFDLSQIDSGIVTQVNTITDGGTLSTLATHTLEINTDSGFLYRCGGGGGSIGLRIYDLSNPATPTFAGEWHNKYVHEAQVVNWTTGPYAGKEIAFCYANDNSGGGTPGVMILDVTDKQNIQQISFYQYSSPSFSHQGWLSPDRTLIYLNDELDGLPVTRIISVADLAAPTQVGSFNIGTTSIDHNIYTKGNLIFEANYRSGLRVYDATNPLAPVQTAFFDTYPENDSPQFNGLWNNYPYFPSDVVIGSDIEKGLFVWWVGNPILAYDYPNGLPALLDPEGETVQLNLLEDSPGDLQAGTAKLHYDAGEGYVEVDLNLVSGTTFDAVFPAISCGQIVSYYFSADSTNGITWRDPPTAPAETYIATAAASEMQEQLFTMESASGWTAGAAGDNATSGIWTRSNPFGTGAQPEDDVTPDPGTLCWFTGQGPFGGGIGDADVDGGTTTLLSPTLDLSGIANPKIGYWRWYSNTGGSNPGADVFVIDISNNNGANWTNVETIGPAGVGTNGGWLRHDFLVSDFVTPTSQVRMRFVASDLGGGSIVEAAIDDFDVSDIDCGLLSAPSIAGLGSRYISVTPQPATEPIALRISSPDLPCLTKYADAGGLLVDDPVFQNDVDWGTLVISGPDIKPGSTYNVQAEAAGGGNSVISSASTPLWGDVDGNSVVNFMDVQFIIFAFQGNFLVSLEAADLEPCQPNGVPNFADVLRDIKAFQGETFDTVGCGDPCSAIREDHTTPMTVKARRIGR